MATTGILVPVKLVLQECSVRRVLMSACRNLVIMVDSVSTRKMGLSAYASPPTLEIPALKVRQLVQQISEVSLIHQIWPIN